MFITALAARGFRSTRNMAATELVRLQQKSTLANTFKEFNRLPQKNLPETREVARELEEKGLYIFPNLLVPIEDIVRVTDKELPPTGTIIPFTTTITNKSHLTVVDPQLIPTTYHGIKKTLEPFMCAYTKIFHQTLAYKDFQAPSPDSLVTHANGFILLYSKDAFLNHNPVITSPHKDTGFAIQATIQKGIPTSTKFFITTQTVCIEIGERTSQPAIYNNDHSYNQESAEDILRLIPPEELEKKFIFYRNSIFDNWQKNEEPSHINSLIERLIEGCNDNKGELYHCVVPDLFSRQLEEPGLRVSLEIHKSI